MIMSEHLPEILNILAPVLMALLTWASAEAARWIRARVKTEATREALLRLNEVVTTKVRAKMQTEVKKIRAKENSGELPANEAERLKSETVASVRNALGLRGIKQLEGLVDKDSVRELIGDTIERAVLEAKRELKS